MSSPSEVKNVFSGCESETLDWKCQETRGVVILLTIAESQYLVDHHAAASVGVFFPFGWYHFGSVLIILSGLSLIFLVSLLCFPHLFFRSKLFAVVDING